MSARRLIPCLDVAGGKVLKGVRFQGLREVGDPLELALRYQEEGADEIVMLEIAASKFGLGPAEALTRRLGRALSIPLTVGGGIARLEDAQRLLEAGADRVSVNTAALRRPALLGELARRYGSQAVVCAVDVAPGPGAPLDRPLRVKAAEEATPWRLGAFLRVAEEEGAGEFLVTAIDRDGTGEGYDLALMRACRSAVDRPLIASGGCGRAEHVVELLADDGADAALLASRLHGRQLDLAAIRRALRERGVEVRWDGYSRGLPA